MKVNHIWISQIFEIEDNKHVIYPAAFGTLLFTTYIYRVEK